MRTITTTTTVYKFDELTERAKDNAVQSWRNKGYDESYHFDEITDTVKNVADLFNLKFGREYTDIRCSHIEDDILNLSGVRLYKYLINNYYSDLFKPKYIKSVHRIMKGRQFVFRTTINKKGEPYTSIYSKNFVDNCCTITGVCYDMDILKPVYDFLKRPTDITFEELIREIEGAITKTYRNTEEWVNSDEFIIGEIEANKYEFTEDGKPY